MNKSFEVAFPFRSNTMLSPTSQFAKEAVELGLVATLPSTKALEPGELSTMRRPHMEMVVHTLMTGEFTSGG